MNILIETVPFSSVHDICRSKGASDVSLNIDSTNPKRSDGYTAQANPANDLPVNAPDIYLPVHAPDEYLPVDTPADNLPVDSLGVL